MKANEAPEKIYRTTTYLDNGNGKTLWKKAPVAGAENIEYIRTDAFIEKVCSWFRRIDYDDSMPPFETTEEFIKEFRKYMEGE